MKKYRLLTVILTLTFILAGCGTTHAGNSSTQTGKRIGKTPETRVKEPFADTGATGRGEKTVTTATLPKELAQIPEDYFGHGTRQRLRTASRGKYGVPSAGTPTTG